MHNQEGKSGRSNSKEMHSLQGHLFILSLSHQCSGIARLVEKQIVYLSFLGLRVVNQGGTIDTRTISLFLMLFTKQVQVSFKSSVYSHGGRRAKDISVKIVK